MPEARIPKACLYLLFEDIEQSVFDTGHTVLGSVLETLMVHYHRCKFEL